MFDFLKQPKREISESKDSLDRAILDAHAIGASITRVHKITKAQGEQSTINLLDSFLPSIDHGFVIHKGFCAMQSYLGLFGEILSSMGYWISKKILQKNKGMILHMNFVR